MGNAMLLLLPLLSLIMSSGSLALNQDFCVGDLARGDTPAGYPCKPEATVTAEDFCYRGLVTTGPTVNPFNIALSSAFSTRFPGVNGLDISAARVDFSPGGIVPLHSHPSGTELIYVVEGTLSAGFISSTSNKVYTSTLRKGDLMVFPQPPALPDQRQRWRRRRQQRDGGHGGLLLQQLQPRLQIMDFALFANNLPTDVLSKVTVLDDLEIRKLKYCFVGPDNPSVLIWSPHDRQGRQHESSSSYARHCVIQ
ncbi:Os04g0288100 [Oryza sativa Japonica Group]|uniref:Germin-like protein n=1 Tax=Oryza sativa subsp. japonica TaxID=39947 RepID=Q0JEE0_ORYSJ|nr:Os04g0288100 [Oryza sativa Japonica Group]|eukprot:NP_001052383.1 Os04g0288100 [Oryza sativa Japonica Group]